MLRLIGCEIFDTRYYISQQCLFVQQTTEPGDLSGNSCANFGFGIFQKLHEGWCQVFLRSLSTYAIRNLNRCQSRKPQVIEGRKGNQTYSFESISDHISDPPTLVLKQMMQSHQKQVIWPIRLGN